MSIGVSASHNSDTIASPSGQAPPASPAVSRGPVRVLLVAETEIIVRGLVGLLAESRDRVEILGPVSFEDDVVAAAGAQKAELVLVDADRRGGVDVGLLAPILSEEANLRVVVFTHSSNER